MELVQLHTRVRKDTRDAIKRIARANRWEVGLVIDEAVTFYLNKNREAKDKQQVARR